MDKTVMVFCGDEPLSLEHIRYIQDASLHGKVIVLLKEVRWGQSFEERREMFEALKGVKSVVKMIYEDDSIAESIAYYRPDIIYVDEPLSYIEERVCNIFNVEII